MSWCRSTWAAFAMILPLAGRRPEKLFPAENYLCSRKRGLDDWCKDSFPCWLHFCSSTPSSSAIRFCSSYWCRVRRISIHCGDEKRSHPAKRLFCRRAGGAMCQCFGVHSPTPLSLFLSAPHIPSFWSPKRHFPHPRRK